MTKSDRSLGFTLAATAFLLGYALADAFPHDKWIALLALIVSGAAYIALFRHVKADEA